MTSRPFRPSFTEVEARMAVIASAVAFVMVDRQLDRNAGLHEVHGHLRIALHAAVQMLQEVNGFSGEAQ